MTYISSGGVSRDSTSNTRVCSDHDCGDRGCSEAVCGGHDFGGRGCCEADCGGHNCGILKTRVRRDTTPDHFVIRIPNFYVERNFLSPN